MKKKLTLTIVFFVALLISSVCIIASFPTEKDYQVLADEGTYFRQAQKINEQGWSGFGILATEYAQNPSLHAYPPPIRIGYIFLVSLALKFSVSYHAISMLSVLFFFLQCTASFFFVKRHWGIMPAMVAGILLCVSPLSMGLARRALSDPCYYLFISISIYSFIDFIRWQRRSNIIQFTVFYTISILIKESALFLFPFFVLMMVLHKYYFKKPFKIFDLLLITFVPIVMCILLYFTAFGTMNKVMELTWVEFHGFLSSFYFTFIHNPDPMAHPLEYVIRYNSGPWYNYFIDYFLLSPITSLLFFLYVGYYFLTKDRRSEQMNLLLMYFIYFMIVFFFIPKNVRFAQTLDLVYRICAALMIVEIFEMISKNIQLKKMVAVILLMLIVVTDSRAFYNYFLDFDIYDPTTFNMLSEEKFFFGEDLVPLEQSYIGMSYYYFKKGKYEKCIDEARKAISFNPNYTVAYINICSAYNEMKDWDHAIEAGKKAVEIDPNNQLAKNNLNWAISQKQSGK